MKLELRPHRSHVAVGDTPQKLFVALRVSPEGTPVSRATPAVAVAVDTSGSMYARMTNGASRMDVAVEVVGGLAHVPGFVRGTEIALLHFDTEASVLLPLSVLYEDAAAVLSSHAERLRDFNGGTMIAKALALGRDELGGASPGTIRKVILITDGETGDEAACFTEVVRATDAGIGLFCVGIGEEYNEELLMALAERARGGVAHVDEGAESRVELRDALQQELVRAQRETLVAAELEFGVVPSARVVRIDQVYPRCQALPQVGARWLIGNIAEDDEAVFLAELDVVPGREGALPLADVALSYSRHDGGARTELSGALLVSGVTDAASARAVDQDVLFYVRQRNVTGLIDAAATAGRDGDAAVAGQKLAEARRITQMVGNDPLSRRIDAADRELAATGTIRNATRKSLRVSSRMNTLSLYGGGGTGLAAARKRLLDELGIVPPDEGADDAS